MISAGVTFAIPNWNHELLLARSIQSALKASRLLRKDGYTTEILVIDDHSRDGSVPLLRQLEIRYWEDGLRVVLREKNQGLCASRNLALTIAANQAVLFMDADNELIPENVHLFLETMAQTGAAAVYGNLLMRTVTSKNSLGMVSYNPVHPRMFTANYIDAFALVDREQVIECGMYDSGAPAVEDYEQWLHLTVAGRSIIHVPVVLGYYYLLPDSMIAQDTGKHHATLGRLNRVFNQLGAREGLPMKTLGLRHHPATGTLCN